MAGNIGNLLLVLGSKQQVDELANGKDNRKT